MDERTRRLVRPRAGNRCEYCELTEAQSPIAKLQRWADHFVGSGVFLSRTTDVGRTTIRVLEINAEDRIRLRLAGV